jgi:hypothetical protein
MFIRTPIHELTYCTDVWILQLLLSRSKIVTQFFSYGVTVRGIYIFSGYTASAAFPCQSSKAVCLEHPQYWVLCSALRSSFLPSMTFLVFLDSFSLVASTDKVVLACIYQSVIMLAIIPQTYLQRIRRYVGLLRGILSRRQLPKLEFYWFVKECKSKSWY